MATVELSTRLECAPEDVWERVRTAAVLMHVAAPLIRFVPKASSPFPRVWAPGEYRAWMRLFGVLPIGWQAVVISEPAPDGETRFIRDNGYGPLVRRWDHWITIAPDVNGTTRYTDRVEIEAGLLTPLIVTFARVFYAHRQRRWRALARSGFRALRA
jgi:ligand-binding SRPBCC domain-containing protein